MIKICVTGHRNLMNLNDVERDIALSLQYFQETYNDLEAISAIAEGADTLFVEAAKKYKIRLKFMIPFEIEEYKKDFKGVDLVNLERNIEENTGRFIEVNKLKTKDKNEKELAYLKTGQKMVDEADIVLAVWDGNPAMGKGGTGDIVAYAKSKNKELHIIKGVRANNHDVDDIQQRFEKLNKEAIKYKNSRFLPTWVTGITMGVLAVVCFAIVLTFSNKISHHALFYLSCLEVLFLIISFILLTVYAKEYKQIFLINRRNAEYLRTLIWFKNAGIPIPKIEKSNFKISDKIKNIEDNITCSELKKEDIPNAKRIAWCLAQEQINYHNNTIKEPFERKNENIEMLFKVIVAIFFVAVTIKFGIEVCDFFHLTILNKFKVLLPYIYSLIITLPPVCAALEGVKYFGEWKRNIAISKKIAEKLEQIKINILKCSDEPTILKETKQLRETLEIENSDWAIRFDEKEISFQP